jgi:quinol monooxygenase YgiN
MILLTAYMTIKPSSREAFLQHMRLLVREARADAGCLSFDCYEDVSSTNTFLVLQAWQSRDALDKHEQSAYLAAFKTNVHEIIAARRETQVFTVSEISGL